jgi:hypothetical protein
VVLAEAAMVQLTHLPQLPEMKIVAEAVVVMEGKLQAVLAVKV